MATLEHFSAAHFDAEVLRAGKPVVVYFTSAHCAPCKRVTPVITQLAEVWGDIIRVGALDIYQNFYLTLTYGVLKAPTLMLFVNGQPVTRVVGFLPKDELRAKFEAFL